MGSNLVITKEIENYINNHSLELSTVQKEIISYNNTLGDIKTKISLDTNLLSKSAKEKLTKSGSEFITKNSS